MEVSVAVGVGNVTAVEEEAGAGLSASELGLFVPQALIINKAINTNQ
jgi:hypothetical protein